MKCGNPNCTRGIGLVSYHRGWFDKRRFCSKQCRDDLNFERSILLQPQRHPGSYFEWLFAQPVAAVHLRMGTAGLKSGEADNWFDPRNCPMEYRGVSDIGSQATIEGQSTDVEVAMPTLARKTSSRIAR